MRTHDRIVLLPDPPPPWLGLGKRYESGSARSVEPVGPESGPTGRQNVAAGSTLQTPSGPRDGVVAQGGTGLCLPV